MNNTTKMAVSDVIRDVHTEHCCAQHGCKYSDSDCPVASGNKPQSYPCESCEWGKEDTARHNAAQAAEIDALRTRLEDTVRDSTNKIEALRAELREAWSAVDSKAGWEWKKRAEQAEARAERLAVDEAAEHIVALRELYATRNPVGRFARAIKAGIAALAQQPTLPSAPVGVEGLPRYGFPDGNNPRPVPCADGYWTPWHLAQQPAAVDEAWLSKARSLYDRCSVFPETNPDGVTALLQLRNHVYSILATQPEGSDNDH